MGKIKILIAEDEELIRKNLVNKVRKIVDHSIVYEAENGREAYEKIMSLEPDIVLLDIRMPYITGVELMEMCGERFDCQFIIISSYSDFDYARKALEYKALGYLLKPIENKELLNILQKAINKIEIKNNITNKIYKMEYKNVRYALEKFLNSLISDHNLKLNNSELASLEAKLPYHLSVLIIENSESSDEYINYNIIKKFIIDKLEEDQLGFGTVYVIDIYKSEGQIVFIKTYDSENQILFDKWLVNLQDEIIKCFKINAFLNIGETIYRINQLGAVYTNIIDKKYSNCQELIDLDNTNNDDITDITIGDIIEQAKSYIGENFSKELTLTDMAKKYSVSPSYFSKAFKIQMGVSYSSYLTKKRIEQAKKLLACTDLPISEISRSIGYDDVQYFYRVFKRNTKLTPAKYRRNVRCL